MVGFEAASYVVAEGAGPLSVCLTKDKTTALPVLLSLTAQESTPPSATGICENMFHTIGVICLK